MLSYTNKTAGDQTVAPTALGLFTNYARVKDEPTECKVSNKTASLEQPEIITFKSKPVNKVDNDLRNRNPGPSQSGVVYSVTVDTLDRVTVGDGYVDEPCRVMITFVHSSSNNWTNAKVAEQLQRAVGALLKGQTTTGTPSPASADDWRFEDLMRSALAPVSD